jgi:hypothetical protein
LSAPLANATPPKAVLRIINPLLKTMLGSPLARFAPSGLAVLRFKGRKTGRAYGIVVGWHEIDGERVVFSPAGWSVNFRGGAPVEVITGGRTLRGSGTLVEDPEVLAPKLQQAVEAASPRDLGLKMNDGHRITPDDVRAVGRRMIRFDVA